MVRTWGHSLFPLLVFAFIATPAFADRAHDLAQRAQEIQPERCKNVKTSTQCHANYPAWCSTGSNPGYDACLNFLKNQAPGPEVSAEVTRVLGAQDFEELEGKAPQALGGAQSRRSCGGAGRLGRGEYLRGDRLPLLRERLATSSLE